VRAFRTCGYLVADTSGVGGGFPDLLVKRRGVITLVEIKTQDGRLNALQLAFHASWGEAASLYVMSTTC
jgi:hypothetical protein